MFVLKDLVMVGLFKKRLVLQKILSLQHLRCSFRIACLNIISFKVRSKTEKFIKNDIPYLNLSVVCHY